MGDFKQMVLISTVVISSIRRGGGSVAGEVVILQAHDPPGRVRTMSYGRRLFRARAKQADVVIFCMRPGPL